MIFFDLEKANWWRR